MYSADSIAAHASGRYRLIPWLLATAAAALVSGLLLPVMEVDKFFLFTRKFSIMDSLVQLIDAREYFLTAVIFVFTVAFPVAKLVYAAYLWARVSVSDPGFERRLHLMDMLGRWSMLDVLLLAIAVASIKMSVVGSAHANPGLYLFATAIILAMIAAQWLKSAAHGMRGTQTLPDR